MIDLRDVRFAVLLAPCGVAAGWLGTQPSSTIALVGAVVAAFLVVFVAPPRVVVWVAGAGVLVSQGSWGEPFTSVSGADLYAGDMLAFVAVAASVVQRRQRKAWGGALALVLLLWGWAWLRSDALGAVAFARLMTPLVALLLVVRLLPDGHDLRKDLRWFPLVVLASVFLLPDTSSLDRWASIAGGANETGLIGALAIGLGCTYPGWWRFWLWVTGATLLAGTAAITASIAAGAGALYWMTRRAVGGEGRQLGSRALVPVLWGLALGTVSVRALRLDVTGTIDAHWFQVSQVGKVLSDGNPIIGTGWANVDRSAFFGSDVAGLHNVYLDVIAYLGIVGALLFLGLVVKAFRRADPTVRTLLVVWLVWINTTGAFPGTAWGVLGFILAAAALRSDEVAEQGHDDALRGTGRRGVDADLDHAASRSRSL